MKEDVEETLLRKVTDLPKLKDQITRWRRNGDKVIFTNGVFDLLHIGHITYLSRAAELGDKLIIGLNSDPSVKRLKGDGRPVNDEHSRAIILAALFFVDAVVVFEEDTPLNLIGELLPDVLVKGADYLVENIIGAKEVLANGGEVKTISFIDGYSSTAIIRK